MEKLIISLLLLFAVDAFAVDFTETITVTNGEMTITSTPSEIVPEVKTYTRENLMEEITRQNGAMLLWWSRLYQNLLLLNKLLDKEPHQETFLVIKTELQNQIDARQAIIDFINTKLP